MRLSLGSGTAETHVFTPRYFRDAIGFGGLKDRSWDYETDECGNDAEIGGLRRAA